jgi:hypothetical protein
MISKDIKVPADNISSCSTSSRRTVFNCRANVEQRNNNNNNNNNNNSFILYFNVLTQQLKEPITESAQVWNTEIAYVAINTRNN